LRQATYRHIGIERSAPVNEHSHLQLDLIVLPQAALGRVHGIQSEPLYPLASHHYAVTAQLDIGLDAAAQRKPRKHDRSALRDRKVAGLFASKFAEKFREENHGLDQSPDDLGASIDSAFKHAEKEGLPMTKAKKQKPWISAHTSSGRRPELARTLLQNCPFTNKSNNLRVLIDGIGSTH